MTSLSLGERFAGQYRLKYKLAQGGMGQLYVAEQAPGCFVVIKLVHAHLVTQKPESLQRLRVEARALAHIRHPNVVRLLTYGETEQSQPYLVMEYVPGHTLAAELRSTRISVKRALHIALQICLALQAAHELGVIHRDLKPDNIMLTQGGIDADLVKLLDFGIAKITGNRELTRTGVMVGTPKYIAPERIEHGLCDARTDLYAVGLILYEMLSGQPPFQADTPFQLLRKQVEQTPIPLSHFLPGLPVEVDMLVQRCLEKEPAQRYQSADELGEGLRDLIAALPMLYDEGSFQAATAELAVDEPRACHGEMTQDRSEPELPFDDTREPTIELPLPAPLSLVSRWHKLNERHPWIAAVWPVFVAVPLAKVFDVYGPRLGTWLRCLFGG